MSSAMVVPLSMLKNTIDAFLRAKFWSIFQGFQYYMWKWYTSQCSRSIWTKTWTSQQNMKKHHFIS